MADQLKENAALKRKVARLEWELKRRDGWWMCESCGGKFGPARKRFDGGDVDLCKKCFDEMVKAFDANAAREK